jgi:hypothetical protein
MQIAAGKRNEGTRGGGGGCGGGRRITSERLLEKQRAKKRTGAACEKALAIPESKLNLFSSVL